MSVSRDAKDWKLIINRPEPRLPSNKILNLGWQFSSESLIVQVSSTNQLETWQVAGKIWATSVILASPTRFFEKNLDLSEQELITIPKIFPGKYTLYYRAPRHFTNVRIKIWEYVGEIVTETDLLSEKIELLLVQNKILEDLIRSLKENENPPDITVQEKAAMLRIIGRI